MSEVGDSSSLDETIKRTYSGENTRLEDHKSEFTALQDEKKDVEEEPVYITGYALYRVLGAVTLVCFLMFLDISIVATVRLKPCYLFFSFLTS
jgi:hypothetical protein